MFPLMFWNLENQSSNMRFEAASVAKFWCNPIFVSGLEVCNPITVDNVLDVCSIKRRPASARSGCRRKKVQGKLMNSRVVVARDEHPSSVIVQ
ncbi:hypothetical protein CEXT_101321 [Caerostris extrusa]|uniref:Uncharacterized protein n=1 Tax=Caerostris extrusa TaxID=172846 RepID=A0AAV4SMR1_CAEEX|nr:hypothetical protein CEXT_101321 [Caerostris extrusa]